MHKLTFLILALLLTLPTSGRAQSDATPIAPCLPQNAALIRMEGINEWGEAWIGVIRDIPAFYALEGEYVKWLGYAPDNAKDKEWQGVEYGFAGIDMRRFTEDFFIMLYSEGVTFSKREIVGRIEAHLYNDEVYVLFFTRLTATTDANGKHLGYHIYSDPRNNGEACMFWIDKSEFNEVLGWD